MKWTQIWKTFIIEYKLGEILGFLNSVAYDSDFIPNKADTRFKDWTTKGITILCNIMKEGALICKRLSSVSAYAILC